MLRKKRKGAGSKYAERNGELASDPVCCGCKMAGNANLCLRCRLSRGGERPNKAPDRAKIEKQGSSKGIRRGKYRNVKTEADGHIFDSKKEAARYQELKLMQQAGDISNLRLQPKYCIHIENDKICDYIADFAYIENRHHIVEDVKGIKTAVYRLKKKLLRAIYGIDIRET